MNFTREQLDTLVDALYGLSTPELEFEVREDYSGRGMYGKTCIGFVTSTPLELHGAICAILAIDENNAWHDGNLQSDYEIYWYRLRPSVDSMGRSSIVYYSNLSINH